MDVLHSHYKDCPKNPGHKDFIPVNNPEKSFSLEDLPENQRDVNLFGFIKLLADLTVCINVDVVSGNRPEGVTGSEDPYPFYGQDRCPRCGTGSIFYVKKATEETKRTDVRILTARHVVFDDYEAQHTECFLFYDSDEEKNESNKLQGVATIGGNINGDWVFLECFTEDMELGRKLMKLREDFFDMGLENAMRCSMLSQDHHLSVIVSHPHGRSKQVTVGEYTNIEKQEDGHTRYKYTTPTCPGSSGAPIYLSGTSQLSWVHIHSEALEEEKLNASSLWFG